MTRSKKRLTAEAQIFEMLDVVDPSGYNTAAYKKTFNKMDEKAFTKYMTDIASGKDNMTVEIAAMEDKYTLDKIFKMCKAIGVETSQHIIYTNLESADGQYTGVSPTPCLILRMPVKRLQQMLDKKNAAASDIDTINPLLNQVTGDSKAAGLNDAQVSGLLTTGQLTTVEEMMGPRSDDSKSKDQMLQHIEDHGMTHLKDLDINTANKQALQTTRVFLKGAGLDMQINK